MVDPLLRKYGHVVNTVERLVGKIRERHPLATSFPEDAPPLALVHWSCSLPPPMPALQTTGTVTILPEQWGRISKEAVMARRTAHLPLVYSCSGCSSAAQLTNQLAVRLDRAGKAQMSCISGVGGDVPSLVKLARSGRPILALDGCSLACVRNTLRRHDIVPDRYVQLQEHGVTKRYREDAPPDTAERLYPEVVRLARELCVPAPTECD